MRVLLVEDDSLTTRAISLMLKADCAAVVDTADTAEEALEMARHYDYDAVLLDLMLPDMDGLEALRRLRAAGQATPSSCSPASPAPRPRSRHSTQAPTTS